MFRVICFLVLSLSLAGPSAATHLDNAPRSEIDALYDAIDHEDFASLEALYGNAQQSFLDGRIDADHMRALMTVFYVNNPDLIYLTERWRAAYPKSAYARVAEAWLYHRISWDIRGSGPARQIYPDAVRTFAQMQRLAWELAIEAYEIDSRFIPASDAVIRLANPNGGSALAHEVLEATMETDPNMGTLMRATSLSAPGWGGFTRTQKKADALCTRYGPKIEWSQGDAATYCKLYAMGTYHRSEDRLDWFKKTLMSGEYPDLEHLLLPWATHHTATRYEAEFARRVLNRDDVTDVEHARDFDLNIAPRYGFEFVSEAHTRRAWTHARESIARDPYNVHLIEALQKGVTNVKRTETGSVFSNVEKLSRDEEIEFARRKLQAAPYTPENWRDYGRLRFPQRPENLLLDEPYLVNAVVYSDHSAGSLFSYATTKWRLLANLERLEADLKSDQFNRLNKEQKARARSEYAKLVAARERMDLDRDLKCPMMRAYRLYKYVCQASKEWECENPNASLIEMLEIVRAEVTERRACQGVMTLDEPELLFEYQEVDLSAPEG